ncbi:hypothetical protein [Nocardiopsis ganjiahuensis]|uniref:hypothetical protein n=1 Tax=Nocardiopsis ganjiahuensis TaxID=239984 RepID=UPI0030846205
MPTRARTLFAPRLPLVSALALALLTTSCTSDPAAPEPVAAAADRGSTQSEALLIEDAWMPEFANPEVGVVYLAVTTATADAVTGVHTSASPDADLCNTETTDSGAGRCASSTTSPNRWRSETPSR